MADDTPTVEAVTAMLREAQAEIATLKRTLAAVRAEPRLTVVKLRDDEASPVAAPCALAGACQYREGFAKMLFNPPTE